MKVVRCQELFLRGFSRATQRLRTKPIIPWQSIFIETNKQARTDELAELAATCVELSVPAALRALRAGPQQANP